MRHTYVKNTWKCAQNTPGCTLTITCCLGPKRTSPKVLFEVCVCVSVFVCVSLCMCVCVFVCACMIWVTSSHLVLALRSQACFLFSPPLPRNLLPPSGIGLWKAGQVSPTRMAWKYTRIHQPSCRSLLSQLLNLTAESRVVEYIGLSWVKGDFWE